MLYNFEPYRTKIHARQGTRGPPLLPRARRFQGWRLLNWPMFSRQREIQNSWNHIGVPSVIYSMLVGSSPLGCFECFCLYGLSTIRPAHDQALLMQTCCRQRNAKQSESVSDEHSHQDRPSTQTQRYSVPHTLAFWTLWHDVWRTWTSG